MFWVWAWVKVCVITGCRAGALDREVAARREVEHEHKAMTINM